MGYDRAELEGLDRESLVARAQDAGIRRARILTRPELVDELLRSDPSADERELKKSRGFFGRARDLVARVVERGLHLPDAADRIRTLGTLPPSVPRTEPQAVPTVTLAEIYAAQGHPKRAIATLKLVLDREPDHAAAKNLLARLEDVGYVAPPPPLPPEPEVEPDPNAPDIGMHAATEVDTQIVDALHAPDELPTIMGDEPTQHWAGAADELTQHWSGAADELTQHEVTQHWKGAADEPTQHWNRDEQPAVAKEDPPTKVDDTKTIDMLLAEYVDEPTKHIPGQNGQKGREEDPSYAPTRVLPRKSGQTYAVTPAGAQRARPVDVHADTELVTLEDVELEATCECVALPIGEGRTFVRWSIRGRDEKEGTGSLVLRAHVITPSWDGPSFDTRDLPVDVADGEAVLRGIPERAVLRVAIGYVRDGVFVPLAHSPAIESTGGRGLFLWSTKGLEPIALDDPRSAFIARAAHAARRAAQV